MAIELACGDITRERVDAIVNAANERLTGGGGVDGAIQRAGGPQILEECRRLGSCETGEAKATTAGKLDARYVIHAVGPVWRGGKAREAELLARCHRRAVEVAAELGCRSIAFPAISCGVYGYPPQLAAPVTLGAVNEALRSNSTIGRCRFVLFGDETYEAFAAAHQQLFV